MSAGSRSVKELFNSALEFTDAAGRAEFLDRECGDDAALRMRLDALLLAHDNPESALERPLGAPAETFAHVNSTETAGTIVAGRYKLLEAIGEGGMGEVWVADQLEPIRRRVALKLIKPGMDSRAVLARFEAERQALALMDHPNIAKVLDAGTTDDGRPYFVMELVKGTPITKFCDERKLSPRERLELFIPVCHAIQHAHQKGIIHRDIKPTNVLVALHDENPVPKVIDFGVAKAVGQQLTEKTLYTGFGALIGTPAYMAPEQATFNQLDVDTRADVYALGVLLYELLAGSPPFEPERMKTVALDEVLRLVREEEPPRPSERLSTSEAKATIAAVRQLEPARLAKLLRGELDWIVMKSLDKDRNRRYETANGFAMDVQRYLADEPVQACPPSSGYRLRKFARRNKAALAVAGLILFFLMLLGGGAGWVVRDRATRQFVLEQEVTRALEETEDWYRRDKLPEAMAAVKRADGLLAGGGGSEQLQQRVRQWRIDLEMIERLEEIRLNKANVKNERFDNLSAASAYREAFRKYGLDVVAIDVEEAAERIKGSVVRDHLIDGLDDWCLETQELSVGDRLLAIIPKVNPDPWRVQFSNAVRVKDRKAVKDLALDPQVLHFRPARVRLLTELLVADGEAHLAIEVLRQAQQRHPDDFWTNHSLAWNLMHLKPPQDGEAIRFYQAALALRPESPGVRVNFGHALEMQGKLIEASAEYREAIRLKPDYATPYAKLGLILSDQGRLPEAVEAYRKAIHFKPDFGAAYNNLGKALNELGKHAEAEEVCRKAIQLEPEDDAAYTNLGLALLGQGRFGDAVAPLERGHELGSKNLGSLSRSAQLVRQAEYMVELDAKLPKVLKGEAQPADVRERLFLAHFCVLYSGHYAAAVRFYSEAFTADPKLVDDLIAPNRYNAACAAALAGCGRGKDTESLDAAERARLRRQALDWLRADLAARGKELDAGDDEARAKVRQMMQHCLRDADFGGVREPNALAKLPEGERQQWQKLWEKVKAMEQRAAQPK